MIVALCDFCEKRVANDYRSSAKLVHVELGDRSITVMIQARPTSEENQYPLIFCNGCAYDLVLKASDGLRRMVADG